MHFVIFPLPLFQNFLPIEAFNNVRINESVTFLTLTMLLVIFPLSFKNVPIIPEELA